MIVITICEYKVKLAENWFSENPLLFLFSAIEEYSQFPVAVTFQA
jgi:hypothetical protein